MKDLNPTAEISVIDTPSQANSQPSLINLDNFVTVDTRSKWWTRRTHLERYLFVVIILLSISYVTLIISLALGSSFTKEGSPCMSKLCVSVADELLQMMDESIDPCEDFYSFTCGGYFNSTDIPRDKSSVGSFQVLDDKLTERLRKLIEEPGKEGEIKSFKLLRNFYESCMNTRQIEKIGLEPIKILLDKFGGWPVLEKTEDGNRTWNPQKFSWIDTTYLLHQNGLPFDTLFELSVTTHLKNTSKRIIELRTPHLGLSLHNFFDPSNKLIYFEYAKYQINLAILLGANRTLAIHDMTKVLKFERDLAIISLQQNGSRNASRHYNQITIQSFQSLYPSIPWLDYINHHLAPYGQVDLTEVINISNPPYFLYFEGLINQTDKRILANYILWRVVQTSVHYLNEPTRSLYTNYKRVDSGILDGKPRWQECVGISTSYFPLPAAALYVRRHFDSKTSHVITEMTNNIRTAFMGTLSAARWLDEKTRGKAIEKLVAMGTHIGHPLELMDDSIMAGIYENLTLDSESYFQNHLNLEIFETNAHLAQFGQAVNKNDWRERGKVAIVNAFYHSLENSINIPAGILKRPFFDEGRPQYLNYGAIGWVIGHELSHAFDDRGSQFDGVGNLNNWWTIESRMEYKNRTECIIRQYDSYTIEEIKKNVSGHHTQGENLADNGGIREAYRAYKDWIGRNGKEASLPGLKYSPQQMFWISGGSLWCSKSRKESLRKLMSDPHAPGKFRVIGAFSNMQEFSKDFECARGTRMNPENKCRVW